MVRRCSIGSSAGGQQRSADIIQQWRVGWRHGVVRQGLCGGEGDTLAFHTFRFAPPPPALENRHQQMEVIVGVAGEGERRQISGIYFDSQFFRAFPDQTGFGAFARFDLAAGNSHRPAIDLPSGRSASRTFSRR